MRQGGVFPPKIAGYYLAVTEPHTTKGLVVMINSITYVAMDTHKKQHEVAPAKVPKQFLNRKITITCEI